MAVSRDGLKATRAWPWSTPFFNNLDRMSPELRLTLKHYLGE
jgi:hypothetical protein